MDDDLHSMVARIDERTKSTHDLLKEHIKSDDRKFHAIDKEVAANTKFRNFLMGVMVVGGGGTGIGAAIAKLMGH